MVNKTSKKKKRNSFLRGALVSFILFLLYISALIYFVVRGGVSSSQGISPFPGGVVSDLAFLFIAPMLFQIFAVLLAPLFTRFYIWVAKLMKSGKYPVHVKKLEKKFSLGEFFSRTFYAAMLSIAMSISLNTLLGDNIYYVYNDLGYSTAALSMLLTPLSVFLMTPAWILDDSGVLFMKKENFSELSENIDLSDSLDIRGIGSYFLQIVKGFAGISTPLLYIQLFITDGVFGRGLELGILLILEPFLLVGSFFFSMWIYLKLVRRVRDRLLRKLNYPRVTIKIEK